MLGKPRQSLLIPADAAAVMDAVRLRLRTDFGGIPPAKARGELLARPENSADMGSVLSGRRGYYGGKTQTTELPSVSLVRGKVDIQRVGQPLLLVDADRATVIHDRSMFVTGVEASRLHLGGERRWLVCPGCASRRKTLYIVGQRLACRACAGLRYPSQVMNRRARAIARADRIRQRLGWGEGALRPWGERPIRMHRVTFDRAASELAAIEGWLIPDLAEWVERAMHQKSGNVVSRSNRSESTAS